MIICLILQNFQDELPGSSFTDVVPHPEDQQELKSILRQVNAKDANREGKKEMFLVFKNLKRLNFQLTSFNQKFIYFRTRPYQLYSPVQKST